MVSVGDAFDLTLVRLSLSSFPPGDRSLGHARKRCDAPLGHCQFVASVGEEGGQTDHVYQFEIPVWKSQDTFRKV